MVQILLLTLRAALSGFSREKKPSRTVAIGQGLMIKKAIIKKKLQNRRHNDLVGIDFATSATKIVRLKQSGDEVTLIGIDMLPAVDFNVASTRIELPRNLLSYYGCLCYSCPDAVIRMINTPLAEESSALPDSRIRELLNVTEDYRPSAALISRGKGRQDSSFLAAAIPSDDVGFVLNMFPAGPPAPASLEVSGLAVISAFLNAKGKECADEAVCLIEAGESTSHFTFINNNKIVLLGKMDFGSRQLRQKLAADLGVDDDLADSILSDRSINISSSLAVVLQPFAKQISISKDFIERHQGCRIAKTFVSGGLSLLPSWVAEMGRMLHTEVHSWNPLDGIQYDAETLSPDVEVQITRYAAAIGAALGGLEDK
jgi:Tfp pilus assembly PilM family ATPase